MKKGDVVTIQDTSYMRSVINGELKHPGRSYRYRKCMIIELGCAFPKTSQWEGCNHNDTIVQDHETGQIIFIEECFLKLVPPTYQVMVDIRQDGGWMYGQIVEISDKLYKEIKRESQS